MRGRNLCIYKNKEQPGPGGRRRSESSLSLAPKRHNQETRAVPAPRTGAQDGRAHAAGQGRTRDGRPQRRKDALFRPAGAVLAGGFADAQPSSGWQDGNAPVLCFFPRTTGRIQAHHDARKTSYARRASCRLRAATCLTAYSRFEREFSRGVPLTRRCLRNVCSRKRASETGKHPGAWASPGPTSSRPCSSC